MTGFGYFIWEGNYNPVQKLEREFGLFYLI